MAPSSSSFLKVFDSYLWETIIQYITPLENIDDYRELFRTLAPVNRFFYHKIRDNRTYWEYAYYLTFMPRGITACALHKGPVDYRKCNILRCEEAIEHFISKGYTNDHDKHEMCKHGYMAHPGPSYSYSAPLGAIRYHCYSWSHRCRNPDHYTNMLTRSVHSRFKDLFPRTARRWVKKHARSTYRIAGMKHDLLTAAANETYHKRKRIEMEKSYKRAKLCSGLLGIY